MNIDFAERERQRVAHLVQGQPRPKPPGAPSRRARKRAPKPLTDDVERRVSLREKWSHKQGTPETHEHHEVARGRAGALVRLHASHGIDDDQLAAAEQIRDAYRVITTDVRVRTASLEARVDGGGRLAAEEEPHARVRAEQTYTAWRTGVVGPVDMFLAVILDDLPVTVAATRWRMSARRARRLLGDALSLWWTLRGIRRRGV